MVKNYNELSSLNNDEYYKQTIFYKNKYNYFNQGTSQKCEEWTDQKEQHN